MLPQRFARELACCLLAIAVLEFLFYLNASDDFSLAVYVKSVFEVFIAPLHPGWNLTYPPFALIAIFGLFKLSAQIGNSKLRVALMLILAIAWTALGFHTIVVYYQ